MNWVNRIVRYGEVDPAELLANPDNWRIHPIAQQEALSGVLEAVGQVQSVLINLRTSEEWGADRGVETMIDGHLRVQLALRSDEPVRLPAFWVDLEPDEERVVLASLDPIGAMAVTDEEKLSELLGRVETEDLSLVLRHVEFTARIPKEAEAPEEFPAYDEGIDTAYRCPKCGYRWSGSPGGEETDGA